MNDIWAIVLAAGESKRMGSPKMLLPLGGKTMIENVIGNIVESEIRNIMVVLGSGRENILNVIDKLPVQTCFNSNYKTGMLSSVKCGIRNLPADFRALLVFLGDQPGIAPSAIKKVTDAYIRDGKGIVIPTCGGKRGHPLLLDSRYAEDVLSLGPQENLGTIPSKFKSDILEVEVETQNIVNDIDTKEDYSKILKQHN